MQKGNIKAGDGGGKFRAEWPEMDKENWKWIKENKIDPATGIAVVDPGMTANSCAPAMGLRRPSGSVPVVGAVVEGGREGGTWIGRHKLVVAGAAIFVYVLIARLLGSGS